MKCPAWPLSCFADLPPLSLQVNFNEPLSMLQRLTEDLEYHELLDKAVKCESSTEQMCFVAAFSVSSYSTTVHRTAKPFNPLLGETYELDRLEEFGFRSLCEQVRHGLRAHQAAALCRCSCPAKVAPSPKETQHLLVLSLPPGRDSQRGAPGTGRSSSKHNLSYLQEHCVAVPALQSRRWGEKKGKEKSICHHGTFHGSLLGSGVSVTSQHLSREGEDTSVKPASSGTVPPHFRASNGWKKPQDLVSFLLC